MSLQKVMSGYRVTIPYEIRKKLGIKVGDWVIVEVDEERGVISIIPTEVLIKPRKRLVWT